MPRFDNLSNSKLANLANTTIVKLLEESCFKDKIEIGKHMITEYGVGKTHNKRYGSLETGKYDGIHLFGPTGAYEYTKSLSNILSYAISQNSFSALSEGNF